MLSYFHRFSVLIWTTENEPKRYENGGIGSPDKRGQGLSLKIIILFFCYANCLDTSNI